MKTKVINKTVYGCEICDMEFDGEAECRRHESEHPKRMEVYVAEYDFIDDVVWPNEIVVKDDKNRLAKYLLEKNNDM